MERDRYGLTLSTASAEAAAAYREGLDLTLAAYPGAEHRARVKAEIKGQERRLLRPGGVVIHSDEP